MPSESLISLLRKYISEHNEDSDGSWENEHRPHIEKCINNFSKQEIELLESEIWSWSDFHLFQLAAPIYHSINPHLNSEFIFTKIFAKISREEYLSNLYIDLAACFRYQDLNLWDSQLLKEIQGNLLVSINQLNRSSAIDNCMSIYNFIEQEINNRT